MAKRKKKAVATGPAGISGSYNNTLKDNLANPTAEIAWMVKYKTSPSGWDHVSLYGISSSKMNDAFAAIVKTLYGKKIKIGIACSRITEVNAVIAYNKKQTETAKKIAFITTELEAEYANNNCTIAEYRAWIPQWYALCKAASVKLYVYEGWNYNYDITVPNSDGIWLHAYRTGAQMATKDDMYNYMSKAGDDRLVLIAAFGRHYNKVVNISVLTSCENVQTFDNPPKPINGGKGYGWNFYNTRPFGSALPLVQDSYNRLGTADIKTYTKISGEVVFVSRHAHLIKP